MTVIKSILTLSRGTKKLLTMAADLVVVSLALWTAMALRLGSFFFPVSKGEWLLFLAAPAVALPVFLRMGVYRVVVGRHLGFQEIWKVAIAGSLASLLWGALLLLARIDTVPRSVVLIYWMAILLAVGGSRLFARRMVSDKKFTRGVRAGVVIYGAGSAGVQLAAALLHSNEFRPVAFLDDDADLQGSDVAGLRVHPVEDLGGLVSGGEARELLMAIPSVSRSRIREILDVLASFPVSVRTLPGISELAQGRVRIDDLRELDIAELLGRDPVPPNDALLMDRISEKTVMVTGAGGSIGSELCRQIVPLNPQCLILFEQTEFSRDRIEEDLCRRIPKSQPTRIVPVLGSVQDEGRVEWVCRKFGVQTIYHAAAYKHVPLIETNPSEAIHNNIFGTLRTAQAALATGVDTFVLISTDKAVRPTSVMGATKRFAELTIQGLDQVVESSQTAHTKFCMVRFGNVLASSGSVVPLFREQIRRGGPVTVTHREVIRYFMTLPEAAQLVIQASAMANGGEVFVLDMGEPVRILDLARLMIRQAGLRVKDLEHPDGDIEIQFSGLRPGEKLHEELLIGDSTFPTDHPKILRGQEERLLWSQVEELVQQFEDVSDSGRIKALLLEAHCGYQPQPEQ